MDSMHPGCSHKGLDNRKQDVGAQLSPGNFQLLKKITWALSLSHQWQEAESHTCLGGTQSAVESEAVFGTE